MKSFENIKIAVAGTGYVGLSIATLLSQHHQVTAVDVIPEKVDLINQRKSPIQDDYIEKYFVDRIHGDWYNNVIVDETGLHIVDGMHGFDKLNGGKCPFHNSQMCFEVMERTARLLKKEDS